MKEKSDLDFKYKVYGFIGMIVMLIIVWLLFFESGSKSEETSNKEPSNIELMSYTQTVLEDKITNPNFSNNTKDYNFIGTGLRYKIEGIVNGEKFYLIINFVNEDYKEYDIVSLQVGSKKIV